MRRIVGSSLSWATVRRWSSGPAWRSASRWAPRCSLAAGDPLGAALPLGLGAAHWGSGLVFSPHCCQKARILAWSNESRVRTRPQTMAWNGVDIWSNRAMTGPMTPFGVPHTGPGGKASKKARSWACPSGVAPALDPV